MGEEKNKAVPEDDQGVLPLDFEEQKKAQPKNTSVPSSFTVKEETKKDNPQTTDKISPEIQEETVKGTTATPGVDDDKKNEAQKNTEDDTAKESSGVESQPNNEKPAPTQEDADATQKDFHTAQEKDNSALNNGNKPDGELTSKAKPEAGSKARKELEQQKDPNEKGKSSKKHHDAMTFSENASIGRILHEARISCGLSVQEVEGETRISATYIEAMEHDNFKELPPSVYVKAYIRSLCGLYDLSKDMRDEIQHGIKEGMENIVSEEIIHHLEMEKQVNVEDEQKVKRLFYIVASAAGLVLILIATSITFMFMSGRDSGNKQPELTPTDPVVGIDFFDPGKLDDLTLPVQLDMTLLKPPADAEKSSKPAKLQ